jgi:multidrug resistance efflux pump
LLDNVFYRIQNLGTSTMIKNALKTSVILFILGLTSGCISQQQLDSVEAAAQSASRSAAAAMSAAEAAQASADTAQRTADRAMQAAMDAQDSSNTNWERLERMFKKSMEK